jgi:ATP-dependent protease ClpP protease subunit
MADIAQPLVATKTGPKSGRLQMYGPIGFDFISETPIDAKNVSAALAGLGDIETLDVRLQTGGGSVWDGLAIYNMLREHPAEVTITVDGIAASAGSIILMAGDKRRVPKSGMVMIHSPMIGVFGGKSDLQAGLNQLEASMKVSVGIYSERTSQPEAKIVEMMEAETWMTGEEAVSMGFADAVEGSSSEPQMKSLSQAELSLFSRYTRIPDQFSRLVSMQRKEVSMSIEPASNPVAEPTPVAATASAPQVAAAPVTATVPAALNAEEIAEKAVAKERGRIAEVTALCKVAGFAEATQSYIESGATPETIRAELFKKLCEARPSTPEPAASLSSGPEAKLNAEYRQHQDIYEKQGLTEEQFAKVRKLESGEVTLNFPGIK